MTPNDHLSACTCLGSGYATPTGHHPGCPVQVRAMRRERYRATDSPVTTDVPLRAHLTWVAKNAAAMEELIATLGPDPAADNGPGFPCTCLGRENESPSGHHPGCPNHDHFLRWYRDRMTNVPQAADPRPGYASLSRVDAPYRITDSHGE